MRPALLRFLGLVLLAGFAVTCVELSPDAGQGGGGASACDDRADCAGCVECAKETSCQQQTFACQQNSVCLGLDQCLPLCADDACRQGCYQANANGVADFEALQDCLFCDACRSACSGRGVVCK